MPYNKEIEKTKKSRFRSGDFWKNVGELLARVRATKRQERINKTGVEVPLGAKTEVPDAVDDPTT